MNKFAGIFLTVFLSVVTLSWDAPTTNTDGTPLTDLAGYKVYCGQAAGVYDSPLDAGNVLSYRVSDSLAVDGTYFCAATAYDTSGNESTYSNEVTFPLDRLAPGAPINLRVQF